MHVLLKTNLVFEEISSFELRLMGGKHLKRFLSSAVITVCFNSWLLLSPFLSNSHLKYVRGRKYCVEFTFNNLLIWVFFVTVQKIYVVRSYTYLCSVNVYTVETLELFFRGEQRQFKAYLLLLQVFLGAFTNGFSIYFELPRDNNWNCDSIPKHLVSIIYCSIRNHRKTW